ncbi:MAG: hypothetical protein NDJ89_15985 [Oligoflexia bacterium]|nr:hypothetical protein [Oligoflexia bacterium]
MSPNGPSVLRSACWLAVILVLAATSAFAEVDCARLFSRVAGLGKDALLWLPRQQLRYWRNVKDTRGRRLLLVTREPREKFNYGWLADPFAYPFTLPPELLKAKFNLSVPAAVVASTPGVLYFWEKVDSQAKHAVSDSLSDTPGAEYASALAEEEMIASKSKLVSALGGSSSATDLAQLVREYRQQLRDWMTSRDPARLPRFSDLRASGILRDEQEVRELNELALSAVKKAAASGTSFSEAVATELMAALRTSDRFSKRPESDLQLLGLLLTPSLRVAAERGALRGGTYSDIELFARIMGAGKYAETSGAKDPLVKLRPHAEENDAIDLLKMALTALDSPKDLEAKANEWRRLHPSAALPAFAQRPDLPAFSKMNIAFDAAGNGKDPKELTSELGLWNLIWTDRRFTDVKAAVSQGQLTEKAALAVSLDRIAGLNQIYALAGIRPVPTDQDLCALLSDSEEARNGPIADFATNHLEIIAEQRSISVGEVEGCKLDLAELFYRNLVWDVSARTDEERKARFEQDQSGYQRILKSCPTRKRSCS